MFRRTLTSTGHRAAVALAKVEMMVDMSVEMIRTVEPRSRSNEDPAGKPFRPIVAIWGAVVRRNLIVSIRTNRWLSDADGNLCGRVMGGSHHQDAHSTNHKAKLSQCFHNITFIYRRLGEAERHVPSSSQLLHLSFQTGVLQHAGAQIVMEDSEALAIHSE